MIDSGAEDERRGPNTERTGGRQSEISFSLSLYLSFSLSLCLCLLPTSAVSQSPTGRPTSQAGCAAPFCSHTNSSRTTTGKGLLCFHLQVLSPTSLGVDLVIIINNRSSSRDKPWAFQNSRFCLWDGVARTDKLGVYLKGFYFGQRSASHRQRAAGHGERLPSCGEQGESAITLD